MCSSHAYARAPHKSAVGFALASGSGELTVAKHRAQCARLSSSAAQVAQRLRAHRLYASVLLASFVFSSPSSSSSSSSPKLGAVYKIATSFQISVRTHRRCNVPRCVSEIGDQMQRSALNRL